MFYVDYFLCIEMKNEIIRFNIRLHFRNAFTGYIIIIVRDEEKKG